MAESAPPEEPSSSPSGDAVTIQQGPAATELSSSNLVEEELAADSDPAATRREPKDRAASMVGRLISGRYRIHQLIGQGGMGAVYRGEQIHLRKRVAIKLLRADTKRLPEIVARFEREAIAGAHVQHPNVASAIDFGQLEDRSYFLVLEYVEGTPLKEVVEKDGHFSPIRALTIAREIASALEAVHAKSIVHRDIKPQNILLDEKDHVKII